MQSFRAPFALCILALATLPFLAGCGGGGGGGGPTDPISTSASITRTAPNGLTATLKESANSVSAGSSITYTYTLTNNTANPITISASSASPTRPTVTLGINGPTGALFYASLPPPPPLVTATLAPGQSLTSTEVVPLGGAGVYSATAKFGDLTPVFSVGTLAVTVR
ncbi:MAG: hypothetical protein ABIY70_14875 [Capsulimonas sp.]|uniref:hypothetical protein n=1 Tax=Capsulimonas sp. TaxID=2494211 RepID=UPI0032640665